MAPRGGRPPRGGGWREYQRFSTQDTAKAPPWSRTHSAARADTDPGPGPARAEANDASHGESTRSRAGPGATGSRSGTRHAVPRCARRRPRSTRVRGAGEPRITSAVQLPAVDADLVTGDVLGVVRRQEGDDGGDLIGLHD